MIILCLEGCHGSGKSTLCNEFEKQGFTILKEAFLDMPDYALHPQTLLMETTWVCSWFERVLKLANKNKSVGKFEQILIADRSPFSAVFYANHGKLLEPLIRQHLIEVKENTGIEIYTIHVKVERELLWSRIQHRLQMEPTRVIYKEDKKKWMDHTLDFYSNFKWDMTIKNNTNNIEDAMNEVVQSLSSINLNFKAFYNRRLSINSVSSADVTDSDSDHSEPTSPISPMIQIAKSMESSFIRR